MQAPNAKRGAAFALMLVAAVAWYLGLRQPSPMALQPSVPANTPAVSSPPASAAPAVAASSGFDQVRPIFENRCAVCHGCYDAPCQLKLDSAAGLVRGATKAPVYDGTRLLDAPPTRLGIDAGTPAQWREKGFFPVVYEGDPQAGVEARLAGSLLYRMLALKREHPMPKGSVTAHFDLDVDHLNQCPAPAEFDRYAARHPLWGMPYALPGLSDDEFNAIRHWLEAGAPIAPVPALSAPLQAQVDTWERFLNGDDRKTQLMARYIYEHLFLADLYFADLDTPASGSAAARAAWFRLVRSRTPPGQPAAVIATRRPYDDPGVARVYYRLMPVHGAILAKTHLPYALDARRLQRYRELFLDPDYSVAKLPSYAPDVASNPFVAFHDLPVRSRYRFLLDDAAFTIGNFIKGPVCRGQLALNVIDDRFWVVFANPDNPAMVDADFLARESRNLRLPAEIAERKPASLRDLTLLTNWRRYEKQQAAYLAAKAKYLHGKFGRPDAVTLKLLWDGTGPDPDGTGVDGRNTNAALTIFRHFDSASVVRGLVGDTPKTAWVIDYPLLERIHYLLVAGFDVYGNASHQLLTRLYMDFLRMEGEYNFLYFMPARARDGMRNSWYRGVGAGLRDAVYRHVPSYRTETGVVYKTRHYKREFFAQMRTRLGPALSRRYALTTTSAGSAELLAQLQKLSALHGYSVAYMPEIVFLRLVRKGAADELFTLLHNSDYANVAVLLLDRQRRRPALDTLTVAPGIIGAYPNAFWRVTEDEMPAFIRQWSAVRSQRAFTAFEQRYGIGRDNPRFWLYSDWVVRSYRERAPLEAGLFDYNRYQ